MSNLSLRKRLYNAKKSHIKIKDHKLNEDYRGKISNKKWLFLFVVLEQRWHSDYQITEILHSLSAEK